MARHPRTRRARQGLRRGIRKVASISLTLALLASGFVSLGLVTSQQAAEAADTATLDVIRGGTLPKVDQTRAQVWVSQGKTSGKTGLYRADVSSNDGQGETQWRYDKVQAKDHDYQYNALAYNPADGYLYAMEHGTGKLKRFGADGTAKDAAGFNDLIQKSPEKVLPSNLHTNQGTFGEGEHTDTYFFRDNAKNVVYAYNMNLGGTTSQQRFILPAGTPNFSDFSYRDGYLWAVDGMPDATVDDPAPLPNLYKIAVPEVPAEEDWNLKNGIMADSVMTPELVVNGLPIERGAYGAQWFFGNGQLGLSINSELQADKKPYYQIQLVDPLTGEQSVKLASTSIGRSSVYNDGTSFLGPDVDLGVTKTARKLYIGDGIAEYAITVRNESAQYTSSGYVLHDSISDRLSNPVVGWDPSTDNCTLTGNELECFGTPLAPGAERVFTVKGEYSGLTLADECIPNTAWVLGNEADPVRDNNSDSAEACPTEPGPLTFVVQKSAVVDQAVSGSTLTSTVPGGKVDYAITVTNNSDTSVPNPDGHDFTEANPASFEDSLLGVTDDARVIPGSIVSPGSTAVYDEATRKLAWSGPLAAGASVDITYSVTVAAQPGDYRLVNQVTPGPNGSCVSLALCETRTPVAGYVVSKSADKSTVSAGGIIEYTIDVTNVGAVDYPLATTPAANASFTDDLSDVLASSSYSHDAAGGMTFADELLAWDGSLAIGETKSFSYTVDVNAIGAVGDGILDNTVEPDTRIAGSCLSDGACDAQVRVSGYTVEKVVDVTTAMPGSDVHYTVTVKNIGLVDYTTAGGNPASFSDNLRDVLDDADAPSELSDELVYTPGDEAASTVPTISWSGDLAVDEEKTFGYTVTATDPFPGDETGNRHLYNVVEPGDDGICAVDAECETSTLIPDRSLTPTKVANKTTVTHGDDVTYTITLQNTGVVPFTTARPATFSDPLHAVLDDAELDLTSITGGASYDAASKTLSWAGPLAAGASVTVRYTVTVRPTHTVTTDGAVDTVVPYPGDYELRNTVFPCDGVCATPPPPPVCEDSDPNCVIIPVRAYTVEKSADVATTHPDGTVGYTITLKNPGKVAYADASFVDDLSDVVRSAAYNDDALYADDPADADFDAAATDPVFDEVGSELSWSGALSAGESKTFTYTVTVNDKDNVGDRRLDNTVEPTAADGYCALDGVCEVSVPISGYTVEKSVDKASAEAGDNVTYTITVRNVGLVAYAAPGLQASFEDDVSGVLDDASAPFGLSAGMVFTPADAVAATPATITWAGDLAIGQVRTFSYTVTVNNPLTGDRALRNVVVAGDEGSCFAADRCNTLTTVPERTFTVTKVGDTTTASPGDVVTYTIAVTNTGDEAYTVARPARFSDPLHAVLDDAELDLASITGGASYDAATKTLSWAGPLPVSADPVLFSYSVTVKTVKPYPGDYLLANTVFTVVPPCPDGTCPPPPVCEDSDPNCVLIPVRAYTVEKSANVDASYPDGTVQYTITLKNPGKVDYTDASFVDDLSDVVLSAAYNNDAVYADNPSDADFDAAAAAPAFDATTSALSWSGALLIGESKTFTYTVTINDKDNVGDRVLDNTVEPTADAGYCALDGVCEVSVPIGGYTVEKSVDKAEAAAGEDVTYTVTVRSIGLAAYAAPGVQASFEDDVSGVLDDASDPFDLSPGLVFSASADSATPPTITWAGDLAVGQVRTFSYTVTVNDPLTGDKLLRNVVVPTGTGGDCVEEDDCTTQTPLRSFELGKLADVETSRPGHDVRYTITVTNTGALPYTAETPASFSDPLHAVLDDAELDLASITGGASYDAATKTLLWAGPLALDEVKTIQYTVTVKLAMTHPGDYVMSNTVIPGTPECTPGDAECEQPPVCVPGPGEDPNCVVVPISDYTVAKTVDAETAAFGQRVTYSIVLTNTGRVDYSETDPLSFTDDLSDVLDDAILDLDSITGGATYAAPTLSWSSPLAQGESATVTYTVTVKDAPAGDLVMLNTVVTPPESDCEEGVLNPGCSTKTVIPPLTPPTPPTPGASPLASTGVQTGAGIALALLALGSGITLTMLRRRRTTGTRS